MIIDSPDTWGHFLHARKLVIDYLLKEPRYTYWSVAQQLSMDPVQVQLIASTPVDPRLAYLDKAETIGPIYTELARQANGLKEELTAAQREVAAWMAERQVFIARMERAEQQVAEMTTQQTEYDKRVEQLSDHLEVAEQQIVTLREEHTRAILRANLHSTLKGYTAGENADAKAWRERAEAAEATIARIRIQLGLTLDILQALKNYGADTNCGACMEIAFTGVTTNEHSCKPTPPPPPSQDSQNMQGPPSKFIDTPLKRVIRTAFDSPTIANIEAVAEAGARLSYHLSSPIQLSPQQEEAVKSWAADDRLWTTQETVEFNLRTFARLMLKEEKET